MERRIHRPFRCRGHQGYPQEIAGEDELERNRRVQEYTAFLLALNISSLPALAVAFILGGAYVGMEETLEDSLAAELLPNAVRGMGFGTMALVNGVGDFISSLCVGWLWAAFGARVGFGFALVLMTIGIVVVSTMRYSSSEAANSS